MISVIAMSFGSKAFSLCMVVLRSSVWKSGVWRAAARASPTRSKWTYIVLACTPVSVRPAP